MKPWQYTNWNLQDFITYWESKTKSWQYYIENWQFYIQHGKSAKSTGAIPKTAVGSALHLGAGDTVNP